MQAQLSGKSKAEFRTTLANHNNEFARKRRCQCGCFHITPPKTSGQQTGIKVKILIEPDVDKCRRARRANQF